jgi:hypothetical protein
VSLQLTKEKRSPISSNVNSLKPQLKPKSMYELLLFYSILSVWVYAFVIWRMLTHQVEQVFFDLVRQIKDSGPNPNRKVNPNNKAAAKKDKSCTLF